MINKIQYFYDKIFSEIYHRISKFDSDPDIVPTYIVSIEQGLNVFLLLLFVIKLLKLNIDYIEYSFFVFVLFFLIRNLKRYLNKVKRERILKLHTKPSILFKIFSTFFLIGSIWLPLVFILKFMN